MDKAVILCVFDFVSFHVCKALLEKGVEINGVTVETTNNGKFLDEKRMEIGRNANFFELSYQDWIQSADTEERIILSLYDLYMLYQEDLLKAETFTQSFFTKVKRMNKGNGKLILIVPRQLLADIEDQGKLTSLSNFVNQVKKFGIEIQIINLPTMYGPWQPETFIFQHSILENLNRGTMFKGIREETEDALYIEDALKVIVELIESEKTGDFLLKNSVEGQWNQCASFLQLNVDRFSNKKNDREVEKEVIKIEVKNSIDVSDGLKKQIELTERLYER
nr:hypothetical protein [Neobacillus sp. Marseille-Q6967]